MDFFHTIQFYNETLIKNKGHKNKYFLKFMMLGLADGLLCPYKGPSLLALLSTGRYYLFLDIPLVFVIKSAAALII